MKITNIAILLLIELLLAQTVSAAVLANGKTNAYSRVRDSAGFSKVLAVLPPATPLSILAEKGMWYQIQRSNGAGGWMAKELIDIDKRTETDKTKIASSSPSTSKELIWKTAKLKYNSNFRQGPSTESKIIRLLEHGADVSVGKIENGWCTVQDENAVNGWVLCALMVIRDNETCALPSGNIVATPFSAISEADMNKYWAEKLNKLRQQKSLRLLTSDERLRKSATLWANYIGSNGLLTHERPDGSSMLAWADNTDLVFTTRNSTNGWRSNYFTENIGLRLNVEVSASGMKAAIDGVLDMFLAEGPSGVHYKSLFHPDWNAVGVAWYSIKNNDGRYKIVFVFHYASLKTE